MTCEKFEREKICYEQNFQHARSINDQMNRVPLLSITLTGGLWFGAALTETDVHETIRFGLLLFAGIANISLVLAIFKIRDVLESYLQKIKDFHEESYATGRPKNPKLGVRFGSYGLVSLYAALMLIGSLLSFVGAFFFYWPFKIPNLIGFFILVGALLVLFFFLIRKKYST